MTTLLLSLVLLAGEPLSVRVLEHEKPTSLTLDAKSLSCDGAVLPSPAVAEVGARTVRIGERGCAVVSAVGPVTVTSRDLTRTYLGTLRVVVESGLLKVFNELDVEPYLVSVVGAESGGSPRAALEAQAIVSRTFALTARRRHAAAGYDVCDLTHCQLYRGQEAETAQARAAVEKTAGQVLLVGGIKLQPAFFHAACGGHTSSAADVFREDGASPGVSDVEPAGPLCRELPDFTWEWTIERLAFASALGLKAEGNAFEALRRDRGGRVIELKSFGRRFTGDEFFAKVGRAFGYQSLRSLKTTAQEVESTVHFTGTGLGHGVGLCQQGAKALATRGATTKTILQRYFPDCQVRVP